MVMSRWGMEGPPEEMYSRVTNPERFLQLHDAVLHLADELERVYMVARREVLAATGIELVRPSIELVPASPASASIRLSFTAFPGVRVRFGSFLTDSFPSCGCDACDESAEGEMARLGEMIDSVAEGKFRETIRVGLTGRASLQWELSLGSSHRAGGGEIQHSENLPGRGRKRTIKWQPWQRRA